MKLIDAISVVESNGDQYAMRFENVMYMEQGTPWWLSSVKLIQAIHPWFSPQTCRMIACTSWGEFQLLGADLYGEPVSYKKKIALYLAGMDQEATAVTLIKSMGFDPNMEIENTPLLYQVAAKYNGPENPVVYARALLHAAGINP